MSLFHYIQEGGIVMYILIALSVVNWAVFLYKLLSFIQFKKLLAAVTQELKLSAAQKDFGKLKEVLHKFPYTLSSPYLMLIESNSTNKEVLAERLARKLQETHSELKSYIWVLGTIASSSPFIGLLGTVMGIISSLQAMATSGKGGFSVVAGGISTALVDTAAGIIVAVCALIFYNFVNVKLAQVYTELKHRIADFSEDVTNGAL